MGLCVCSLNMYVVGVDCLAGQLTLPKTTLPVVSPPPQDPRSAATLEVIGASVGGGAPAQHALPGNLPAMDQLLVFQGCACLCALFVLSVFDNRCRVLLPGDLTCSTPLTRLA